MVPAVLPSSSSDLGPCTGVAGLVSVLLFAQAHALPGALTHGARPGEASDVGTIGWAGRAPSWAVCQGAAQAGRTVGPRTGFHLL